MSVSNVPSLPVPVEPRGHAAGLNWNERVPEKLRKFVDLMRARPAVQLAMKHEGLE